ncbi:hypothetical protein [Burkholderia sp. Ap-962]|nr:hypothetical protein [Burkholderia sp. Ap-962]
MYLMLNAREPAIIPRDRRNSEQRFETERTTARKMEGAAESEEK